MAGIQHLHREETYTLPPGASTTEIINSEVARRTFWVLQSMQTPLLDIYELVLISLLGQDHLYSEHNAAVAFPLTDITTLLPSDETDFAYGSIPQERAALAGTQAGIKYPHLCSLRSRSPFATLVQAHSHWGDIARRAGRASKSEREKADEKVKPWERASEYSQLTKTLKDWEELVPARHRWSLMNLRGHKAEFLDLAYLSQVMVVRINNIVIRRIYLEDILESKLGTTSSDYDVPEFWTQMSYELFTNVYSLHESFDTWFSLRTDDEGIPSIVVFCVYICGSLASYLWKWPQLCPQLADGAEAILNRSLVVLNALMDRLPHVQKWLHALQKISLPLKSKTATYQHRGCEQREEAIVAPSYPPAASQAPHNLISESGTGRNNRRETSNSNVFTSKVSAANAHDPSRLAQVHVHTHYRGRDQDNNGVFPFDSALDDMQWSMTSDSRHVEGLGGIGSLDLNSGYNFDEELMRLLQEGM